MDSMERRALGLALSGSLSPGLAQAIVLGGSEYVPADQPPLSADNFRASGAVTAPQGVTTLSQDPAQE